MSERSIPLLRGEVMYSNRDIEEAIAKGALKIEPLAKESVRSAGITLHLGSALLKPLPGKVVDVKAKVLPDYREISIDDQNPYRLEPQEFVLGHTLEKVTVGTGLGFFIEGRSTLARLGLTVVKTAMLVQPGHRDRTITLELGNHGPNVILLYPRMKIVKAVIFELKTPTSIPYDDEGKYRHQCSVGRPVFTDEFLK